MFQQIKDKNIGQIEDVLIRLDMLVKLLPLSLESDMSSAQTIKSSLYFYDVERWRQAPYICYYVHDMKYNLELVIIEKDKTRYIWDDINEVVYQVITQDNNYKINYCRLTDSSLAILDNILEDVLKKKGKVDELVCLFSQECN